ncbi:MAG: hypothetical protein WAL95_22255 [Candidatus Acidiferrales bacterium]
MNYGMTFVKLIADGLKSEDREFRKFKNVSSVKGVRFFYEDWVRFVVLKQALKNNIHCLEFSSGGPDMTIEQNDRVIAAVELKGPFEIKDPSPGKVLKTYLDRVLRDFAKQARRDKKIQKYVVLLPFGRLERIKTWLSAKLPSYFRTSGRLRRIPKPLIEFIQIATEPGSDADHLAVACFRVG